MMLAPKRLTCAIVLAIMATRVAAWIAFYVRYYA